MKKGTKWMKGMNHVKGGVRLTAQYLTEVPNGNRGTACDYFLSNSTFSVLTNSSISCITLVATLNNGILSPFKTMRSNNIECIVNRLLLKIFITNTQRGWYTIESRGSYNGIEITDYALFKDEILKQIDIYKRSFMSDDSLFDAICPAIVNSITIMNIQTLKFYSKLSGLKQHEKTQLNSILASFGVNNNSISMILMEYMDGFDTAYNVLKNLYNSNNMQRYNYFAQIIQYEFQRLNRLGYRHGDAHLGNVMINPNYQYFTRSGNPLYLGRAIIIDFGRTRPLNNDELTRVNNNDVTVFQEEIMNTILKPLNEEYITNTHLNNFIDWRNNFLNSITIPKMRTFFGITPNANLREYLNNNIINNSRFVYNLGGDAYKKIDNNIMKMEMEMEMENNNTMKMENSNSGEIYNYRKMMNIKPTKNSNGTPFEAMLDNNFKEYERTKKWVINKELQEIGKKFFEKMRLDMEEEDAMDPSLFVKQDIDEQLKNMKPEDFFKLFNDEFSYQDDIVKTVEKQIKDIQENNIKVEMKTGGKSKSNSNKKSKSNSTRKTKKSLSRRP